MGGAKVKVWIRLRLGLKKLRVRLIGLRFKRKLGAEHWLKLRLALKVRVRIKLSLRL